MKTQTPILLLIISFFIFSPVNAQDNYSGEFRGKIPTGEHIEFDEEGQAKIIVNYTRRGLISEVNLVESAKTYEFPAKIESIKWVQIKPGLWINKVDNGERFEQKFPKKTEIAAHYAGYLLDGQAFDNSFVRMSPFDAQLGHLIPGFSLGIWNIPVGTLRVLKIGPELAYKDRIMSTIPPHSTLIYYVYRLK